MATRLKQAQAEAVAEALDHLPDRLLPVAACDLFCGDPLFAGLCRPGWDFEDSPVTGRSYRATAHVCFPYHSRDRRVTMVLPDGRDDVMTALHEFGHVIHWHLQERAGGWEKVPRLEPVTDYALTNELEEFAEAFTAWFYPPRQVEQDGYWLRWSRGNDEFFDRLLCA